MGGNNFGSVGVAERSFSLEIGFSFYLVASLLLSSINMERRGEL